MILMVNHVIRMDDIHVTNLSNLNRVTSVIEAIRPNSSLGCILSSLEHLSCDSSILNSVSGKPFQRKNAPFMIEMVSRIPFNDFKIRPIILINGNSHQLKGTEPSLAQKMAAELDLDNILAKNQTQDVPQTMCPAGLALKYSCL